MGSLHGIRLVHEFGQNDDANLYDDLCDAIKIKKKIMREYQKNKTPELLFYRNKIRNLTNRIVKIEKAETV